jgi:Surface lipoprotein
MIRMENMHCTAKRLMRLFLLLAVVVMVFSGTGAVAAEELSGATETKQLTGSVDFLNDASYEHQSEIADPIEPFNRVMFVVNDKFYIWLLEPAAIGYSKILPASIRECIGNFFYNLGEPVRSVNCLLQGRFLDAGRVLGRFVINSICGVFGLADPAGDEFSIAPVYASFGETLSVWGMGDGLYLVIPLVGPSTLRDFSGTMVDGVALTTYAPWNGDTLTVTIVYGTQAINRTSLHIGEYEEIKSLSFDAYVAIRNGYYQMRNKQYNHSRPAQ